VHDFREIFNYFQPNYFNRNSFFDVLALRRAIQGRHLTITEILKLKIFGYMI